MKVVDLIIYSDCVVTCRGSGKPKTGAQMNDVGIIENAGIAIKDGVILKIDTRQEISSSFRPLISEGEIDVGFRPVLPGFIDSHTHPVYAGNRVEEFIMRTRGATYQEIHSSGGGIQFTVDRTRSATDSELYERGAKVLNRMLNHGTTTVEAKSGYGLETGEELRQLRILNQLNRALPIDVVPTFLGAHSIPREFKDNREAYVNIVINEMLPAVKEEKLARFVDVFCEEGAFNLEETRRILEAARDMGFGLKLHSEEFTNMGSAVLAAKMGATSVDHLLQLTDKDIKDLAKTDTILTVMPGTLFFLDYDKYAPARAIIDGGANLAVATDFNAGSCLSGSMAMATSLCCIKMRMTPEEAINAATYNASFALEMQDEVGSIEEGKKADLVVFDTEDYRLIPYHFGENLVKMVVKDGRQVISR